MHPFGGTPVCPRCSRPVYLAEQAMGPGRKLYHKPCLACTSCNKRLDSFTLLEHDQQPYCKSCHLKNFGTRDLRHANLPVAQLPESPSSPAKNIGGGTPVAASTLPRLKPNRSLVTSPISPTFPKGTKTDDYRSSPSIPEEDENDLQEQEEDQDDVVMPELNINTTRHFNSIPELDEEEEQVEEETRENFFDNASYPSNTGRPGIGTIPRTIPLYLNGSGSRAPYTHTNSHSVGALTSSNSSPLMASEDSNEEAAQSTQYWASSPARASDGNFPSKSFGALRTNIDLSPNSIPLGRAYSDTAALENRGPAAFGNISPLRQTATGSRYGVALDKGIAIQMTGTSSSPRKWGSVTPTCHRCLKNVYFAEQVKAVGKTFHKNCLRCVECNSSLDSNRLRDHDGEPFCVRCYSKLHGPQGGGYALLGKAGG